MIVGNHESDQQRAAAPPQIRIYWVIFLTPLSRVTDRDRDSRLLAERFDSKKGFAMEARKPRTVMPSSLADGRRGFTLIEVMLVVVLIGVLSSIALPSLQAYVWRAKRNEAYINLNGIYKSQKAHFGEFGRYGSTFEEIGFEITGSEMIDPTTMQSRYYTYTLEAFEVDGVPNANYSAVATGDLDPSDAMLDIIMIEGGIVLEE